MPIKSSDIYAQIAQEYFKVSAKFDISFRNYDYWGDNFESLVAITFS